MKKIKSVLCVSLAVFILFLSACSDTSQPKDSKGTEELTESPTPTPVTQSEDQSSEQPSQPVVITFMHCFGGIHAEIFNDFADEFNELNIDKYIVEMTPVDGSYEGVLERTQILSLSNNLPDIVNGGHHFLHFMVNNFPYVPVQTFIDREGYDTSDIFPGMLDLGRDPSGELAALVFGVSTPVIIYNDDLFKANGITAPPRTFDEVREVAKKITDDDHYGIYINIEQPGLWIIQSLIENYGEQMLSADSSSVGFNHAGVEAFSFINNVINVDGSMPLPMSDSTGGGFQGAVEMFRAGNIGMIISSTGQLSNLQKDAAHTVLSAPFPTMDGSYYSIPGGGNSNIILTQDPAKQEAAWEFLKYLSLPENATKVSQGFGYMVISQKAFNTPEMMGDFLSENPAFRSTYDQVPYMSLWLNFPGNSGTRYVSVTHDNIAAMIQGEKTPEQAAEDTIEQLNAIIAQG